MRTLLLFSAASLVQFVQPVQAQNIPATPVTARATQILYFDAKGKKIESAEGADHREEKMYRDSIGGNVRIYYPSGKLRRIVPYLHFDYGIKYGAEMDFYESGELKSRCVYNTKGPLGYHEQFYRNGKLRSRTPVGLDLPLDAKGELFDTEGQPSTLDKAVEKMPTLAGAGNTAIVYTVQRAVRYPPGALRAQIEGKVLVSFMVDDAGFVRNVHIDSTPSPLFNPTVLAAVASLGRLTPGELDGETLDVFFTIPLTFTIQ